jgi:hypothetical protein
MPRLLPTVDMRPPGWARGSRRRAGRPRRSRGRCSGHARAGAGAAVAPMFPAQRRAGRQHHVHARWRRDGSEQLGLGATVTIRQSCPRGWPDLRCEHGRVRIHLSPLQDRAGDGRSELAVSVEHSRRECCSKACYIDRPVTSARVRRDSRCRDEDVRRGRTRTTISDPSSPMRTWRSATVGSTWSSRAPTTRASPRYGAVWAGAAGLRARTGARRRRAGTEAGRATATCPRDQGGASRVPRAWADA